MLRNCACLVIAHMTLIRHGNNWKDTYRKSFAAATKPPDVTTMVWRNMFGRFCSEWTCGRSCLKHWANWPKKQTMLQDRKKTSFFRRRLLIRTNSIVYSFLKTRTHGKNGTKSTYEPTNHTWNSTPSQHFVHLQQNAMLISLRVAITAVTLFKHIQPRNTSKTLEIPLWYLLIRMLIPKMLKPSFFCWNFTPSSRYELL